MKRVVHWSHWSCWNMQWMRRCWSWSHWSCWRIKKVRNMQWMSRRWSWRETVMDRRWVMRLRLWMNSCWKRPRVEKHMVAHNCRTCLVPRDQVLGVGTFSKNLPNLLVDSLRDFSLSGCHPSHHAFPLNLMAQRGAGG